MTIDIEKAVTDSWNAFKKYPIDLVAAGFITLLGSAITLFILGPPLMANYMKYISECLKGKKPKLSLLWTDLGKYFVPAWVGAILSVIILALGFVALIIPGFLANLNHNNF